MDKSAAKISIRTKGLIKIHNSQFTIYKEIRLSDHKSAVALGCFDGMHIGHSKVLSAAFKNNQSAVEKVVFTARNPDKGERPIWLPGEHARLLEDAGADVWIAPDFDSIRNFSPEDFAHKILVDKLRAGRVACGYNFRFGKQAAGNAATLQDLCHACQIECIVVPEVSLNGQAVSTTAIRGMLTQGDVRKANAMLGRCYGYTLPVIEGQKLGRTLGTPTINQAFGTGDSLLLPRFGVYASRTFIENTWHYSVTNFGLRPTIGDIQIMNPISETWVPDFDGDLYGREIRVEWIKYIRAEEKFESLDALREAIFADAQAAKDQMMRGLK